MPVVLKVDNLTVTYNGKYALEDVSFSVQQGERVAIVGPNGAGKSTLFKALVGLLHPTRGTLNANGAEFGYVTQRSVVDWSFPVTVHDTVMMGRIGKMGMFRWPSRNDRSIVAAALKKVEMQDYAGRQIGELSGGQQQRVFLARALAQESELLLLDEPLSGLDMPSQEAFLALLNNLQSSGITMLIATHDLNQAAQLFPQIMLLNHRLVAFGGASDVLVEDVLLQAYGDQMHVVQTEHGNVIVTDTCCGGGQPPVDKVLGSDSHALGHSHNDASIVSPRDGERIWSG